MRKLFTICHLVILLAIMALFCLPAHAGWEKESKDVEFTGKTVFEESITANGGVAGDVTGATAGTHTGPVIATTVSASGAATFSAAVTIVAVDVGDTTNYTVLAANSGHTHIIPAISADSTYTMPAESAGLYYKFVNATGAAEAQDWTFDTGTNTAYFVGGLAQIDVVGVQTNAITYTYSDGNSNSKLGVLTPKAGTVVEMWCVDGTTWYVSGIVHSDTDTGVTFADQ